MSGSSRLDSITAPLDGTLLVEASAGTGKTWAIGALFLRCLLEKELALPGILVLTFTEAATAELRGRLRRRLEDSLRHLDASTSGGDPFLVGLRERLTAEGIWNASHARHLLCEALSRFDEASIFTIHGFCQRVLQERAVVLGLPPVFEVGSTAELVLRETVLDHLRRHWANLSPGMLEWLSAAGLLDPEPWLSLTRMAQQHPDAQVDTPPGAGLESLQENARRFESDREQALTDAQLILRDTNLEQLARDVMESGLNKGSYKPAKVPQELATLAAWLERGAPTSEGELARKYSSGVLATKGTKSGAAPAHPLFDALDAIARIDDALSTCHAGILGLLMHEALGEWPGEAAIKRRETRQLDFSDLLCIVRDGLRGSESARLSEALRQRWSAVLVDEFQDTDPVQWEIFQRAFQVPGRLMVLVGDPKQAIYSFRGADLHTYLEAARTAEHRLDLDTNWRSDEGLVAALNLLFRTDRFPSDRGAFLHPDIRALPVRPARVNPGARLVVNGLDRPPLLVIQAEGMRETKGNAVPLISLHVAEQIRGLLRPVQAGVTGWICDGGSELTPVQGSDIAILVPTHRLGAAVAQALSSQGISSVQRSTESIWRSREAADLISLLHAVASPSRAGLARAVLIGPLGFPLAASPAEAITSASVMESFQRLLHETLVQSRRTGLSLALRGLLEKLQVPESLLALQGGERRATNWGHLLDLLQAEEVLGWTSPSELADQLQRRRQRTQRSDAEELRLESEDDLVQIQTLHKCKGLEFPLVICPFLWDGGRPDDTFGAALVHERKSASLVPHGPGICLDESTLAMQADEALAERLRLAYVALTRARHHAMIYSMRTGGSANRRPSALDWLLLSQEVPFGQVPGLKKSWNVLKEDGAARLAEAWRTLETISGGAIRTHALAIDGMSEDGTAPPEIPSDLVDPRAEMTPAARPFSGAVPAGWRLSSFSSLMLGSHADERLDESFTGGATVSSTGSDEHDAPGETDESAPIVADWRGAFPRGASAGTCLHHILEKLNFERLPGEAALEEHCARELVAENLPPELAPGTACWVRDILACPLDVSGFRLDQVPAAGRRAELEFHLSACEIPPGELLAALDRSACFDPVRLGAGGHSPQDLAMRDLLDQARCDAGRGIPAGFLKGFIDLCYTQQNRWWVLDWKSNWLGPNAASYTQQAMLGEMARSGYFLQALLYQLALHRHLGRTLPEYQAHIHLGGLKYLFIRGLSPDSLGQGVFADSPPVSLILELDELLGGPPCRR